MCALACTLCADASPIWAAIAVTGGQKTAANQPDTPGGYSSQSIVIKLTRAAQDRAIAQQKARRPAGKAASSKGIRSDSFPGMGDAVRTEAARWNASKITPLVDWEFANPELARKFGFDRLYVVQFPKETDTPNAARSLSGCSDDIEEASLDAMGTMADTFPDDTEFDRLWGMLNTGVNTGSFGGLPGADIDAPGAWDIHTGVAGDVTIAIIDSGIDVHQDLTNVIPGYNSDTTSNSIVTLDDCGHGTHVAGTAAATGNNTTGVVGVSWGAKLMPIRVTAPAAVAPCAFAAGSLTAGIIWAADHGADIASMSLQHGPLSELQRSNMQFAIDYGRSLGMISIAATGNDDSCASLGGVCYPARLPGCVAVGATTFTDLPAGFANKGVEMDVAAPGDNVYSSVCFSGGGVPTPCVEYTYKSGTSMATPHVSGLAALLKSYSNANALNFSIDDIEDIITTTIDDKSVPGWDDQVGYGRINAHKALLAAQVWPTILASSPANGEIDARQHTDRLDTMEFGISYVDMDFPPEVASLLTVDDFSVLQKGGAFVPPIVTDVSLLDTDTVRVTISASMEPLAWTTVAHHDTGIVRIGFLPGDVNADRVVSNEDAQALADHFLGVGDRLTELSTDLDWSGAVTPADFLTLVNLLHGADLHEDASGTNLP